jgi:hypothetical protein
MVAYPVSAASRLAGRFFSALPILPMSSTTGCLIVAGSSLAIYVAIALWVIWRLSRPLQSRM